MLGLTACAIPRQFDDSIPRRNYPHESAKGLKVFVLNMRGKPPMPCSPAKARHMLKAGKAFVVR